MANLLEWDKSGERLFETGIEQGVLYPMDTNGAYSEGFAWNGLSAVTESPSGAEANPIYADNIKYLNLISAEEFGATIEAYYYPDAFAECDGSAEATSGVIIGQQDRKKFGLCYKTLLGNDTDGNKHGYKLHLIYGATAAPSEKAYNSVNDSPEAATLSWELTTVPVNIAGYKPTASIVIDSTKADATKLAALEVILYGTAAVPASGEVGDPGYSAGSDAVEARLPLPAEIITLMTPSQG